MTSFLKSPEAKNVMLSIFASIIAGTVTILIAGNYMARKGSEQTIARTMAIQQQKKSVQTENVGNRSLSSSPKPTISIITNELYNNTWNPVLVHAFYGNNNEEIENLIQIHRMSDPFFDSSFNGMFNWRGTEIKLKNTIEYL